jgi:hypothetical protein
VSRQQDSLGKTKDRAVAQAVSRWLPTSPARVRVRAACGMCGGQSGTGAGFLRVLRFPLSIIPPLLVAAVPCGPNWTPPPPPPIKKTPEPQCREIESR